MTRQSAIGKSGEDIAERFLKKEGYKILDRNYREKWGEIDIIARSPNKALVFVEVKTVYGANPQITPEDQVTSHKLMRLRRTAELYANSCNERLIKSGWQIDLVAICIEGDEAQIKHYENI